MKKFADVSWRVVVLLLLGYISYSNYLMNGGASFTVMLERLNPMYTQEGPVPTSAGISFDSLSPEAAERALQLKIEKEAIRNKQ